MPAGRGIHASGLEANAILFRFTRPGWQLKKRKTVQVAAPIQGFSLAASTADFCLLLRSAMIGVQLIGYADMVEVKKL